MRIDINPAAPNDPALVGTHMDEWMFCVDILHPETQQPIVTAGEIVDPWNLHKLCEAGADCIPVQRR